MPSLSRSSRHIMMTTATIFFFGNFTFWRRRRRYVGLLSLSVVCRSKISTYLPFICTSYRPITFKLIFLRHWNCKIKYLFSNPSFAADISEGKNEFTKGTYRFLFPLLITLMCMRKDNSIVISLYRCFYLSLSVCLYACTYMYVCMYEYIYIYIIYNVYIYMYVCIYIYVYIYMYVCMYVCM